ncbi:MAG: hypothetical protein N4A68_15115 [Maledivibacter sp.]|nr:hypothetical protein [Maledivibacter sp.]
MWPLGDYERLVSEIKRRENMNIPVTFGILIADYRQVKCREYILNYINRFNYKSDRYINFYLPGYLEEDISRKRKDKIRIHEKEYYFDEEIYMRFLYKLESDFEIDYPYNPVLLLLEYDRGNFKKSKRIVIELDKDGADIKLVGELFERIFSYATSSSSINNISNKLMKTEITDGLLDSIIAAIDNSYLTAIYDKANNIAKYKLKK